MDTRPQLWSHIVLSGGTTMLPGFSSRLEKELKILYKKNVLGSKASSSDKVKCALICMVFLAYKSLQIKIKVEDPPRRKHLVFDGGSVLADLIKTQDESWIMRADYDEKGAEGSLMSFIAKFALFTLPRLPGQAWLQMSSIFLLACFK
jgi:actin-related protein 2